MILFEWCEDLSDSGELVWFIGCTSCTGEDKQHADEIYQQLDAETTGLAS